MNYVVADVHGFRDSFVRLMEEINLGAADTLYVLGDVIDRGPHPIDMLRLVAQARNVRFLLGNHEHMLLNYLFDGSLERWMRNGGGITLEQWNRLPVAERLDLANFLEASPLYARLDRFLLVHAGLKLPEGEVLTSFEEIIARQEPVHLLWSREEFFSQPALPDMTVIFGHTATPRIQKSRNLTVPDRFVIWYDERYHDKVGIDCGSYQPLGGRLGCLCLDDLREYYVPTLGQ